MVKLPKGYKSSKIKRDPQPPLGYRDQVHHPDGTVTYTEFKSKIKFDEGIEVIESSIDNYDEAGVRDEDLEACRSILEICKELKLTYPEIVKRLTNAKPYKNSRK